MTNLLTRNKDFAFSKGFILLILTLVLLADRTISLFYFGIIYTDIDQLILWNGAVDYSHGIFHEPFFYGQPYNYMLESVIAVPLLHLNVPVYQALPAATSLISVLPFIGLAFILHKKGEFFWACLCLIVPVLLPLEYNFMTSISRGFVQAHLFIPLLFIPLFNPENKKNITLLFIASSICFIANQSSILLIFPIFMYVASFHYKSIYFYRNALWVFPFFVLDFIFKFYYKIHPEKVLHNISGVRLDGKKFIESISSSNIFENLLPFTTTGGFYYPLIFIVLAIITYKKGAKKEFIFILSAIFIILISFAIPKVQDPYPLENAGIFFSSSRFYLLIPLLLIISAFMVLRNYKVKSYVSFILIAICSFSVFIKNMPIQKTIDKTVKETSFPIAKNQDLVSRAVNLKTIISENNVDLIVFGMSYGWNWNNLFDSYALYPLVIDRMHQTKKPIAVNITGDRRSWQYENSESSNRILLIDTYIEEQLLKTLDYDTIGNSYILIKNNKTNTSELFEKLNCKFGNS